MITPESIAGTAAAEGSLVTLDGPDGLAVTFTPEAAAETGRRLIAAAELATTQADDEPPFDREPFDRDAPADGADPSS